MQWDLAGLLSAPSPSASVGSQKVKCPATGSAQVSSEAVLLAPPQQRTGSQMPAAVDPAEWLPAPPHILQPICDRSLRRTATAACFSPVLHVSPATTFYLR